MLTCPDRRGPRVYRGFRRDFRRCSRSIPVLRFGPLRLGSEQDTPSEGRILQFSGVENGSGYEGCRFREPSDMRTVAATFADMHRWNQRLCLPAWGGLGRPGHDARPPCPRPNARPSPHHLRQVIDSRSPRLFLQGRPGGLDRWVGVGDRHAAVDLRLVVMSAPNSGTSWVYTLQCPV